MVIHSVIARVERPKGKRSMDYSELVDRIYESSFVPELWPGVLNDLGLIAEATGGSLFISKARLQYWTASPENRERMKRFVNDDWFWRGQVAARLFGARHAGFLTEL